MSSYVPAHAFAIFKKNALPALDAYLKSPVKALFYGGYPADEYLNEHEFPYRNEKSRKYEK